MKIIYFSGTGNSLEVAKNLTDNVVSINKLIDEDIYEIVDDSVGIIFPCYLWGMPEIVERYLKKVQIKAQYVFIIVTMGGIDYATLHTAEEVLNKNNIQVDYTNHIIMIDNFIPLYETQKQLDTKPHDLIQEKINKIREDIENKVSSKVKVSKKDIFLTKSTRLIRNHAIYPRGDYVFKVNDDCNNCQLCINACPVNNISYEDKIKFNHNCQLCMRCIHSCPKNAIHSKIEKSSTRYINEYVSLNELLQS